MPAAIKIEAGRRFGRWTVIAQTTNGSSAKRRFICKCDCGNEGVVRVASLLAGCSKSCGCFNVEFASILHRTHGYTANNRKPKVYHIWNEMRSRCQRPTHKQYSDYGGRGIKVCERWEKFENFLADMGEPPPGMSLDRSDNDGDYEPGNCAWKTRIEQNNNKRSNVLVTESDGTFTLSEFARRNGLSYGSVQAAVKRGARIFAGKVISVQYQRSAQ